MKSSWVAGPRSGYALISSEIEGATKGVRGKGLQTVPLGPRLPIEPNQLPQYDFVPLALATNSPCVAQCRREWLFAHSVYTTLAARNHFLQFLVAHQIRDFVKSAAEHGA